VTLFSISSFAEGNCKLFWKERNRGEGIAMYRANQIEAKTVEDVKGCIYEAEKLLSKKISRYQQNGIRSSKDWSTKFIRFQFNDGENLIKGEVKLLKDNTTYPDESLFVNGNEAEASQLNMPE
jgi:hypothetical protein